MTHRVVITGIGPVTGTGIGIEPFWQAILRKKSAVAPVPATYDQNGTLHSRWYAPMPHVSLSEYDIRVPFEKIMQHSDRMAVLAARLALEDAGFHLTGAENGITVQNLDSCSILLGTGIGSLELAFDSSFAQRLPRELHDRLPSQKKIRFHRTVIPATMPNAPAAWISICFNIHGQSATINASCASGTVAIGEALRRIRHGYDTMVLAGGVDCLRDEYGAIMRGFDMLGALTRSSDGLPRPFSRDRSGFLFSEGGSCVLVLESFDHARSRNARLYAELLDYHSCSDASGIVQMEGNGTQITRLLRASAHGRAIDYLNAHGTGTAMSDAIEARVIRSVFGDKERQPLINSTKGILGHTLGASGALEAAVCAMSIRGDLVHGNLTDNPLDNLHLPMDSVEHTVNTALTVSYGFGGHNAALVLEKAHE
ncbi:MAG: beta-ketoacyl-[acyl-carrier-protein] synthase family protein [Chitinispirillaceae bacterium]|nr:beta-ketoacyl-[acyl-carrier-protein] synthase family protein [Chitinispirillaceae bacterium]